MREATSQNQRVLTSIQACSSPKDTIQSNKALQQTRHLSLQSGRATNSTRRASPNDNDNSYVKEMWPVVTSSAGGSGGALGHTKPIGPMYQTQNIKQIGQFKGNATLDRTPRSNVRFRDDMSIHSSTRSANHINEDQHIYESPDGTLRGYNAISSNHFVPNATSTLPTNLNKNQRDPALKYIQQADDSEDVWRRRSSKTESVVL